MLAALSAGTMVNFPFLFRLPHTAWAQSADEAGKDVRDLISVLVKLAEVLAEGPITTEYYAALFNWRIEHEPGHINYYRDVALMLDTASQNVAQRSFVECDAALAHTVVFDHLTAAAANGTDPFTEHPDLWNTFNEHVRHEILALYAQVDAPASVGLACLTGAPRDLNAYTLPPLPAPAEESGA